MSLRFVSAVAICLGLAACASGPGNNPRAVLDAYSRALAQGEVEEAYELLSVEAKRSLPYPAFARMVKENPAEVSSIAEALSRPSSPPLVTATVTTAGGETLLLIYEDGAWKIDASAIDLYSQATPQSAVTSFIRAYERKRFDVLMRFVPDRAKRADASGPPLDAERLRAAWQGEQKAEMDQLTQALRAALPTARFETIGERATMAYGAGGTIELLRENGAWKIEEFK